ncbi:hypothetical protein Tco_1355377, partial [Tanacetum coccineum]
TPNFKLVKEKKEAGTKADLLKAKLSFPNVEKLTELLVQSLKPKLSKLLTAHDFSASLLIELKELPSKIININGEIKVLRKLTSQVAYIKNLQLELPAEFHALPGEVSSIQVHMSKLKTLDAFLSLLNRVTEELDMFAHAIELASKKTRDHGVPSACKAGTHPTEGEKNT